MRSSAAVTTRVPQCLTAATPATSSTIFMSVPPWTLPAVLASWMPIQRVGTGCEAEGGFGCTRAASLGGPCPEPEEACDARPGRPDVDNDQGEDLEDARPRRGPGRDPRLRVPQAAGASAAGQKGHRRRRHREEADPDAVEEARGAGGEARHAGAPGGLAEPRGPRANGARAEDGDPVGAPRPRHPGHAARAAAGAADREREAPAREDRGLPH